MLLISSSLRLKPGSIGEKCGGSLSFHWKRGSNSEHIVETRVKPLKEIPFFFHHPGSLVVCVCVLGWARDSGIVSVINSLYFTNSSGKHELG